MTAEGFNRAYEGPVKRIEEGLKGGVDSVDSVESLTGELSLFG